MKHHHISNYALFLICIIFSNCLTAQINLEQATSIDAEGSDPHNSAILDLKSSTQGLLIPRMTSSQRFAVSGTQGLMVYDTDKESFWFHNGTSWEEISVSAGFKLENNVVRNLGNNSNADFVFGEDELPESGQNISGKLFFFDSSMGAFRAGELFNSADWSADSLGRASFAAGQNVLAKGSYSSALGLDTKAIGSFSTALGHGTQSINNSSLVVGSYNEIALTQYVPPPSISLFSVGNGVSANFRSTAFSILRDGFIFGSGTGIYYSSRLGSSTIPESPAQHGKEAKKASMLDSIGFFQFISKRPPSTPGPEQSVGALISGIRVVNTSGPLVVSPPAGKASFSSGINSSAKATASSSSGIGIISNGYSGTVLGIYNDTLGIGSQLSITPETPLLIVGNGDDHTNRSNALVIRKNGLLELGTSTVKDTFDTSKNEAILRMGANVTPNLDDVYNSGGSNFRWHKVFATNGTIQTSDIRAKKNINVSQYGIREILQLKPIVYNWNQESNNSQKSLGLIAQDLQKIIPEVVHIPEHKDDLLGVNYAELIPVLIKGMQEQQALISKLQSQIDLQAQKIQELHQVNGLNVVGDAKD